MHIHRRSHQDIAAQHDMTIPTIFVTFSPITSFCNDIFSFKNCKGRKCAVAAAAASYCCPRIHVGRTRVIQGTNATSRSPARRTPR